MRVELHHWCGAAATLDAVGAAAVFCTHLQGCLEGEARLHREEEGAESALLRSYLAPDGLRVLPNSDTSPNRAASDLARRRHERCCLWPPLPATAKEARRLNSSSRRAELPPAPGRCRLEYAVVRNRGRAGTRDA